ncbi:MAG: hypothetical protein PHW18_04640 [Sulfuricurvum sp.]|uniref:hypothetical protein n=1 Tax=Sulfuricurvum sp. TaxID=2025608 RepID=UPI00260944DE|nr:hypothetical protein [Sulfuricurvum sp.]MDD2828843.1 hypothetical protein [Sulfuricurvum sp.]MDD4948698.1 hypothetical protein [Sulfuricurvum sp.]
MKDNEPTLSSIEDYDTLKGSKKRIVWSVIIIGLFIGALLAGAKLYFGDAHDALPTADAINKVPMK